MDLLEAGKVVKTQGLNGSVKAVSFLGNGSILQSIKEVFIGGEKRDARPFAVKKIRVKGSVFFS